MYRADLREEVCSERGLVLSFRCGDSVKDKDDTLRQHLLLICSVNIISHEHGYLSKQTSR